MVIPGEMESHRFRPSSVSPAPGLPVAGILRPPSGDPGLDSACVLDFIGVEVVAGLKNLAEHAQ